MQKTVSRGSTSTITLGTGAATGAITISWPNQ
jgi:hypothetical protein